jgi:hypothetical protein
MDSNSTLKTALLEFAQTFSEEGRPLDFVGIAPLYPAIPSTSYVLQVHAEWLDGISNCNEALKMVIDRLYAILEPQNLRRINRVDICYSSGEIHCTTHNTLINKRQFELLNTPFQFTEQE